MAVYGGLIVLSGSAVWGLGRFFHGNVYLPPVLVSVWLALLVSLVLRKLRLSQPARLGVGALAGLWFLSLALVPEATVAGLPLRPGKFLTALASGTRRAFDAAPPVPADADFVLVAATAAWVGSIVSEAAAFARRPILGASVWLLFFATAAASGFDRRAGDLSVFIAALLAYFYLSSLPTYRSPKQGLPLGLRLAPGAIFVGLVSLASAFMLPALLPGHGAAALLDWPPQGASSQTALSPLVQIRPRLNATQSQLLFDVRPASSPGGMPFYWRLVALDRFDGESWRSSADYPSAEGELKARYRVGGRTTFVRQTFTIHSLGGLWLPAAYQPVRISGTRAGLDPEGSALIVPSGVQPGLRYEIVSQVPIPSAAHLAAAGDPGGLEQYRQLSGVSEEVLEIAQEITKDQSTAYGKVLAITTHLRSFRYNEAVEPGHGSDQLLHFLATSREGYCEQFAGSMAVLVRAIGLPSRVAVGFLRGDLDPDTGGFRVTTEHAHAWTEVYFGGIGWVPFEPTPRGIASPPPYSVPAPALPDPPLGEGEVPPPSDQADQTDTPPESAPSLPGEDPSEPAFPARRGMSPFLQAAGLLVLAVISVGVGKEWRARGRYMRAEGAAGRAKAAFAEFEDRLTDAGRRRMPEETPAEFGAGLVEARGLDAKAVIAVVGPYERAVYGRVQDAPSDAEAARAQAAVRDLLRSLWKDSGWRVRMSILFSPRSLMPERGAAGLRGKGLDRKEELTVR